MSAARRAAFLIAEEGPFTGRTFQVSLPGILGRSSQADVSIKDPLLSGLHARFEEREGELLVTDLGSMNGTVVHGRRLVAQSSQVLREGSRLRVGRSGFRFTLVSPASPQAPVPPADFVIPLNAPRLDASTGTWSQEFSLVKDVSTIGRDPENDFPIPDITVSRKHARLRAENLPARSSIWKAATAAA